MEADVGARDLTVSSTMVRELDALTRLGDWLDFHAERSPDRVALETEDWSICYGKLREQVDLYARAFLAKGLLAGDCVAVLSPPRPEAFISFLGAARIGLLWLGLNPKYRLGELRYVVGDAAPKLLLAIDEFDGRQYVEDVAALRKGVPTIENSVVFEREGRGPSTLIAWAMATAEQVTQAELASAQELVSDMAPALLVYTSGSSGKPKGVLLPHKSLIRRSRTQNERFFTASYPRLINPLPINHIGGMHFLGLFTFIGGGTMILSERFSAAEFAAALVRKSVNVMIVLPTMFKMIVEERAFEERYLAALEWFVFSGAAMAPELLEMIRRAGCPTGLTYGMTETCGSVTYSDPGADIETLANTIGKPVPAGEVRVAQDDGRTVPVGETGELQVRPTYCMGGYLRRPEATQEAYTADGWLRTGDTAILREDGNIRFVGRRSEMFKSGGYNVYPREVELAIERNDAVLQSAVVAVPDPLFDEVGWAYVVLAPGRELDERALSQWCREELANYKVPKRFLFCSELPLLPIGKVDKVALRSLARSEASRLS